MQNSVLTSVGEASALPARDTRFYLALGLMVTSGFASLGYQIVWTQQSALWLGHESAAVLAVVAAFFGGLALGSLLLGSRIERSSNPARWYAACEMTTGLWSVALIFLLAPATDGLLTLVGTQPSSAWQWSISFGGTFLLLLPATAAMGATLPAMERVLAAMRPQGTSIAVLYAGNTFGAVLGVLATAFWLVPYWGLAKTSAWCAALNLLCAMMALRLDEKRINDAASGSRSPAHAGLMVLAVTGLLGIGYEVLVVRVLSQVAENTVYTFAILLAMYLIGTALGAAAYNRWRSVANAREQTRDRLLQLLGAACLLGIVSMGVAQIVKLSLLQTLGPGMVPALAAEVILSAAAFLLPTVVMGALFSHLSTDARAMGISFGRVLGVNTLGAALAPFVFGVGLLPAVGAKISLLLVAAGYLFLSSRRAWLAATQWIAVAATLAVAMLAPSLRIIDVPEGGRLVSSVDGTMATVSIVEDASGVARLHIDNRQQEGSSASVFADARQALLPLLLHPAPHRALFLGLGTGVTAASASQEATLQVEAVDLLPEVVVASAYFTHAIGVDAGNSHLHLMNADARRFVRATREQYDVIVSDNFHPARSGSGSLYTVEHFKAVRNRLTTGGLFCQWLPLHQLDLETLRSIVGSFLVAFPQGRAMLATNSLETPVIGLVGRKDDAPFDLRELRARLGAIAIPRRPAEFGIDDDLALLGSFIAGPVTLAKFAGRAPLNTDDHPVVTYLAPRITYAPDSLPRDRLIALLHEVNITTAELLAASDASDASWNARLAAYWRARDGFIEAGREVQPTSDVQRMLAQVREPLLSVLRVSPDFRPAYDPLLRMAMALGRANVAQARILLTQLQRVQPARAEAGQALSELSSTE